MTAAAPLRETLRHMVAVLQEERQALAGLDLDTIVGAANDKNALCEVLAGTAPAELDEECRGLVDTARRLNEVNRQVRNLVAANVAARIEALVGAPALYRASPAYAYAGARG